MSYLLWLIFSAIAFAGGEYYSKVWANDPRPTSALVALLCYMGGVVAWFPALRSNNQLAVVGTIWSVLSLLAIIGIGIYGFNERLSVSGWIGIVAALVAVVLLSVQHG